MKPLKNILWIVLAAAVSACCGHDGDFTREEVALLESSDSIMRVLTIADKNDLAVLRAKSIDFSAAALSSDEFRRLSELMIATVTHPSQDGVGIAGPQVGLNRRVVAVQRFDKEGEPFEIYPNIRIVWASDSLSFGPEGCLSVPDRRGQVARSKEIIIEYADLSSQKTSSSDRKCRETPMVRDYRTSVDSNCETPMVRDCGTPMVRDTVKGFTAVIFQHETDHLDGILYIDRL